VRGHSWIGPGEPGVDLDGPEAGAKGPLQ
jgi:hypothetical protein